MHSNLIQQRLPLRRHEEIGIPRMACRWEDSHMPNLTPSSVT